MKIIKECYFLGMTFSKIQGNSGDDKMAHPNHVIYRKMESLVNKMLNNEDGVPIKTVKSFVSFFFYWTWWQGGRWQGEILPKNLK